MTSSIDSAKWPAFIVALFAAFAAFSWWSLHQAATGVSAVSDPDYYSHGLKYHNATLDAQSASAAGWRIEPRLATDGALMVTIRDGNNVTLSGCRAVLTFPKAHPENRTVPPLTLTDLGDGTYSGTLPTGLPHSFSASLTLTKDQATTQRQILINQKG